MPAVTCDIAGGVATVVLDNPAKHNALTQGMMQGLERLLAELRVDPGVRVLVLTGAGDHFCAGADLGEVAEIDGLGPRRPFVPGEQALAEFPAPTVAMIRGWCIGGGAQYAVACDLRIADGTASFGITAAKIGVVYPHRSLQRLAALVGPAAAKHLLFSGELIGTQRALRIGLIDELVESGALDGRVSELAGLMSRRSKLTQVGVKRVLTQWADGAVDDDAAVTWERDAERAEVAEGVAAFRERREPRFRWR
jgi:enoyl-CoA hydratase/carnithine racemase